VRNNLVSDLAIDSGAATLSNNIETTNYAAHFVNWGARDLRLRAGLDRHRRRAPPPMRPPWTRLQAARPVDGNGDGSGEVGRRRLRVRRLGGRLGAADLQPAGEPDGERRTAATFSVAASGAGPLSYQWQKKGSNIGGATASSYTTPATTTADSGIDVPRRRVERERERDLEQRDPDGQRRGGRGGEGAAALRRRELFGRRLLARGLRLDGTGKRSCCWPS
jgi:hypothetical protein